MSKISTTIKDVARKTGLSIATISKYINGGNVLEKNRDLIQNAIDELGYTVNPMARALKTNKSKIIGIAIPDLKSLFFTSIAAVVEDELAKYGYGSIICDYKNNGEMEKEKIDFLINKSVDGIILIPSGGDISGFIPSDIPVVLVDRCIKNADFDVVVCDNLNSSYNAVENLFINGHKRVGIIVGPKDMYTADQRLKGYYRVHEDYSIPIDESLIKYGDYTFESGYLLLKELMNSENPPDSVYATNYEMTLGAIMAVNEMDIKIPDDISFIGFDNMDLVRVINPPISVVVQPIDEIGKAVADLILKRLDGDYSNYPSLNRLKADIIFTKSIKKLN